ncbi:MAG: hypothetical protein NNA18_08825 [Nitrospira sp.]|nr:hypothetical protein [Nitrospira sp.]
MQAPTTSAMQQQEAARVALPRARTRPDLTARSVLGGLAIRRGNFYERLSPANQQSLQPMFVHGGEGPVVL